MYLVPITHEQQIQKEFYPCQISFPDVTVFLQPTALFQFNSFYTTLKLSQ